MKTYSYIIYQITRPLAYLLIRHEDKYIYDWVLPGLLTFLFTCIILLLKVEVASLVDFSLALTSFVNSLPGFFIAALAAVATFNREDIDKTMEGRHPPTVSTRIGNESIPVPLTRRRFLCMLFAYLTFTSIVISIYGAIPSSFNFVEEATTSLNVSLLSVSIYLLVFYLLFFQLVVATLYGLYYLGDRVHY